jgi:hypothetical protein
MYMHTWQEDAPSAMSVEETTETRKANMVEPHSNMEMIVNENVHKVSVGTFRGKEILGLTDAHVPAWKKKRAALAAWIDKNSVRIPPEDRFYMTPPKGQGTMLAVEAHVALNFMNSEMMKPAPCVNIDQNNMKQVQENLTKYIEGNRDMIKPIGPSAAPQTHVAAAGSTIGTSMGASAAVQTYGTQAMKIDPFAGLDLSVKTRKPPYICSTYCSDLDFEMRGGCPTCNLYWKPMDRRDRRVKTKPCKGGVEVVITREVDDELLTSHYDLVKKNNPTWKVENGIPIPPHAKKELGPVPVDFEIPRSDHEQESWDDTKRFPPVPPIDESVERVSFDCSDMCITGAFRGLEGCPTCREFWDGIGACDPKADLTRVNRKGEYLVDGAGKNYETYCCWNAGYRGDVLNKHYQEIHRRYPSWPLTRDQKVHDMKKVIDVLPTLPQTLKTKNPDEMLLPTKPPYNPTAHYRVPYNTAFSWPQPAEIVLKDRNVLAFLRDEIAWLPAQLKRFRARIKKFGVIFWPFKDDQYHDEWVSAADIKFVVWAPSHTTGTQRDESYKDRKVMALGYGTGWKPGKITGLGQDRSKYEVQFDDPVRNPDALCRKELFPYEFCLLLEESLFIKDGRASLVESSAASQPTDCDDSIDVEAETDAAGDKTDMDIDAVRGLESAAENIDLNQE